MKVIKCWCFTVLLNLLTLKMSYCQISDVPQIAGFDSKCIDTGRSHGKFFSKQFRSAWGNTKAFTVIDRGIMANMLSEQRLPMFESTEAICAVEVGGILNLENTLWWSFGRLVNTYTVDSKVVDVQSSQMEHVFSSIYESQSEAFVSILKENTVSASEEKTNQGISVPESIEVPLKSVKIGDQVWMVRNLDVGHYRNSDPIPEVQDNDKWNSIKYGAWCYINNDPEYGQIYGRLYNWYAVNDPRGLGPKGWHIPTDREWKILEHHLGMDQVSADATGRRGTDEGDKLKSRDGWVDNGSGNNSSGFTVLPGGWRRSSNGSFGLVGGSAYIWSASEESPKSAWSRSLYYNGGSISRGSRPKWGGYSIRLIRD